MLTLNQVHECPFMVQKLSELMKPCIFQTNFCFLVSVRPPSFFASSQVHGQIEKAPPARFLHRRQF